MSQVSYIDVILSYDMDTTQDGNINNEIKELLIELGWQDCIVTDDGSKNPLPSTTLFCQCLNLDIARNSFFAALDQYNKNHLHDNPVRKARYTSAIVFESKRGKVL